MSSSMVIFKLNFSYPLQLTSEIALQPIKICPFYFHFLSQQIIILFVSHSFRPFFFLKFQSITSNPTLLNLYSSWKDIFKGLWINLIFFPKTQGFASFKFFLRNFCQEDMAPNYTSRVFAPVLFSAVNWFHIFLKRWNRYFAVKLTGNNLWSVFLKVSVSPFFLWDTRKQRKFVWP